MKLTRRHIRRLVERVILEEIEEIDLQGVTARVADGDIFLNDTRYQLSARLPGAPRVTITDLTQDGDDIVVGGEISLFGKIKTLKNSLSHEQVDIIKTAVAPSPPSDKFVVDGNLVSVVFTRV